MTSMAGKLSLVMAAAAGLSFMALSPTAVEAGVIHQNLTLADSAANTDVVRVRCERSLSNLWSCNDDVRVQGRREVQTRDRYAYHPCDPPYETARDGSRCGNRAAGRKPGGR